METVDCTVKPHWRVVTVFEKKKKLDSYLTMKSILMVQRDKCSTNEMVKEFEGKRDEYFYTLGVKRLF